MSPRHVGTFSVKRVCAAFTAGVVLTVLGMGGCGGKPPANGQQINEILSRLKTIEQWLAHQQSGVSAEIQQMLDRFESRLTDSSQWPADSEHAEQLRREFEKLVNSIPPSAAREILPQLSRLDWGVESIWYLRTYSDVTPEHLAEARDVIVEHLEQANPSAFKEIFQALQSRLHEIESKHRTVLIQEVDSVLEKGDDPRHWLLPLGHYTGDVEIDDRLARIRSKMIELEGWESIRSIQQRLERAKSLPDDTVKQAALKALHDEILAHLVDWQLDNSTPRKLLDAGQDLRLKCETQLNAYAAKVSESYKRKVRAYQSWALEQINYFDGPKGWYYDRIIAWIDSELKRFGKATNDEKWHALVEFPSIKEVIQEKIGVDLSTVKNSTLTAKKQIEIYNAAWKAHDWKNNVDEEIAYRITRDAMIKFLLPIDPHLLERPTLELYNEAFSKGWEKLAGREDQMTVAKERLNVPLKTLEDIGL